VSRELTLYLAIRQTTRHPHLSARCTPKPPKLAAGEILMALNLTIPPALFRKPQLVASIRIPDSSTQQPEITVEMQGQIAEAIREQLGIKVEVAVENAP